MQTLEEMETEEKLNKVIPFIPDGDFYFTKGVEAFQKRKFDIALKWLKKAVEASPNEPLFQCQMSIIYTEIGAYHAANQLLTKVLSVHGDDYIDCYYLIANNYAHLGLLNDAKKHIATYLEKEPDGDFKEEAEELLSVLDVENEDDEDDDWVLEEEDELLLYQETAFHHIERQEWEKAILLLEEMMTVFPDYMQAKHEYSFALFFAGKQQQAIQLELDWLKENPQSLFCHTNLAVFYFEQNNLDLCYSHIESLKNVYPIHEQQKLRIATTLARTGNYEEAFNRFKALSKSQVRGHSTYFKYFSASLYHMGELDKAKSIWKEGCQKHALLKEQKHPWVQD